MFLVFHVAALNLICSRNSFLHLNISLSCPCPITPAGLFRDLNPLFVFIFTVLTTYVFKVASSEAEGGRRLAYMVADPFLNSVTGAYLSGKPGSLEFNPILASEEAANQANGKKIWELTEKIVKNNI